MKIQRAWVIGKSKEQVEEGTSEDTRRGRQAARTSEPRKDGLHSTIYQRTRGRGQKKERRTDRRNRRKRRERGMEESGGRAGLGSEEGGVSSWIDTQRLGKAHDDAGPKHALTTSRREACGRAAGPVKRRGEGREGQQAVRVKGRATRRTLGWIVTLLA